MELFIPKIIQLDISPTFIYLGIGKNFGFNFYCDWAFSFAIVIKGKAFAVWRFYTGDKWTRLCFALGPCKFAIRIP